LMIEYPFGRSLGADDLPQVDSNSELEGGVLPTVLIPRNSTNMIKFIEFYMELGKVDPDNLSKGELKSEVMYKDDKKYHMDLKENARGRFLKVSETFTRGYSRFQVFIPADGMREFQHNLGELIDEYDNGDAEEAMSGPQNKHLRIENKNFYFDIKRNQQGRYMSISEVKGNYRNSILIPFCWSLDFLSLPISPRDKSYHYKSLSIFSYPFSIGNSRSL